MDEQRREPRVGGLTVGLCFDLSRLYTVEAKRTPDPMEREYFNGLAAHMEDLAHALLAWRNACSNR
jgi:hypothetical protein